MFFLQVIGAYDIIGESGFSAARFYGGSRRQNTLRSAEPRDRPCRLQALQKVGGWG